MTTIKDFENQKKETIDFMNKSLVIVPSATAKCYLVSDENASILENTIKQLQPPRPTCSTCNHSIKIYDAFESKIIARECKKISLFKSSTGNAVELPIKNWGCTKHSDYEVTNE